MNLKYASIIERVRRRWLWRICLVLLGLYVGTWIIAASTPNGRVWPWFRPAGEPGPGARHFVFLHGFSDTIALAWLTVGSGRTPPESEDVDSWFEHSPFSTMWSLGHRDPDQDPVRFRGGGFGTVSWQLIEMKEDRDTPWSGNPQVYMTSRHLNLPAWSAVIPLLILPIPALLAWFRFSRELNRTRSGRCATCGDDARTRGMKRPAGGAGRRWGGLRFFS